MSKPILTAVAAVFLFAAAPQALAQDRLQPSEPGGFYGGVAQRTGGAETSGLSIGHLTSSWSKFAMPVADDVGTRTLAYGGYRWGNDLSLEAAVATADQLALKPLSASARGVGLALVGGNDRATRAWNADVYTTWEFRSSFALYGRLGYALSEATPVYLAGTVTDVRRNRDGVNYGVGLRYDMTSALGLRLEYARFGRVSGEFVNGVLPENDQLQFGVQFRF
ncbi:MAG: outer membrane beta-barrel protein [Betaproteobacteria bacterium]